jgi:hypothetical protein
MFTKIELGRWIILMVWDKRNLEQKRDMVTKICLKKCSFVISTKLSIKIKSKYLKKLLWNFSKQTSVGAQLVCGLLRSSIQPLTLEIPRARFLVGAHFALAEWRPQGLRDLERVHFELCALCTIVCETACNTNPFKTD